MPSHNRPARNRGMAPRGGAGRGDSACPASGQIALTRHDKMNNSIKM